LGGLPLFLLEKVDSTNLVTEHFPLCDILTSLDFASDLRLPSSSFPKGNRQLSFLEFEGMASVGMTPLSFANYSIASSTSI